MNVTRQNFLEQKMAKIGFVVGSPLEHTSNKPEVKLLSIIHRVTLFDLHKDTAVSANSLCKDNHCMVLVALKGKHYVTYTHNSLHNSLLRSQMANSPIPQRLVHSCLLCHCFLHMVSPTAMKKQRLRHAEQCPSN